MVSIIIRKSISLLFLFVAWFRTYLFRLKMYVSFINIEIGKNVRVGRMVTIKVTDGGSIVIGDGVVLQDLVMLSSERGSLVIGDKTFVGVGSQLVALESIEIGSNSLIAAYGVIRDANHGMLRDLPMSEQSLVSAPIEIGDDVWLGSHVVVTAGSKIGKGVVVGANAVVTGRLLPYTVAVGIPARPIKSR